MWFLLMLAVQLQGRVPGTGPNLGPGSGRPNIVFLVADDFGVDLVRAYGEGAAPPCTPHIDSLAQGGLLFRNAWADPVCSPTRAALLTGRHGFRTGIGNPGGAGGVLGLNEVTIPEMLSGYRSSCVGKWHLGAGDPVHPNQSGFDYFAGFLGGAVADYESWTKVVNGQSAVSHTYVTRDVANEAIARIRTMQAPWFLYVAFLAPHSPFHRPPLQYCPSPACADTYCGNLPAVPSDAQMAKAMSEVLDAEIGRILAVLAQVDPNAYVFFLGDNGTARTVTEPPFDPGHAKGTPYEQGLNVPLLVRGPGVVHGECNALVGVTDLYATVAQLAGVAATAEDSVSMVPYFSNPQRSLRHALYAERFAPNNGSPPYAQHDRAVRDERYKLIRRIGQPDEFYDLWLDPLERMNRLQFGLNSSEREAETALITELVALGVN